MSKYYTDYYGTHMKFDEYPKFGILSSLKVITTGVNIAGPFAGAIMAEMGAQVIQIEHPKMPCSTRGNYRKCSRNCWHGLTFGLSPAVPVRMQRWV